MTRTIDVDMSVATNSPAKAFDRFFKKYPDLEYWRGELEYMAEVGCDFECDNLWADGTRKPWSWALHLDIEEGHIYIAVVERA